MAKKKDLRELGISLEELKAKPEKSPVKRSIPVEPEVGPEMELEPEDEPEQELESVEQEYEEEPLSPDDLAAEIEAAKARLEDLYAAEAAAKAEAEAKAKAKAEAEAKAKAEAEEKAKAEAEAKAKVEAEVETISKPRVGKAYKWWDYETATWNITPDIWAANQLSDKWEVVYVWYVNGQINRLLTNEELIRYCPH